MGQNLMPVLVLERCVVDVLSCRYGLGCMWLSAVRVVGMLGNEVGSILVC